MRPTRFGIRRRWCGFRPRRRRRCPGRYDVGRVGQRLRRVAPHARLAKRHQHLAFGAELHHGAALVAFAGKLLELLGARRPRVGHPDVAVAIDVDAVRPHEHPAPKLLSSFPVSSNSWTGFALVPRQPGAVSGRAAVGRPHGLPVAVDGHAVGAAPRPFLRGELRPIADHAVRIGAAVDRLMSWATNDAPADTNRTNTMVGRSIRCIRGLLPACSRSDAAGSPSSSSAARRWPAARSAPDSSP